MPNEKTLYGSLGEACFLRAKEVMPGGVSSPVRACSRLGIVPPVVIAACKDKIIDVSNREYIDYCGSWGALIHGHAHEKIISAVTEAANKGTSYGITAIGEIEFAEYLVETLNFIDKVRFVSSGTEAAMTAVRLARAATGRNVIVKFEGHYHGHADVFLGRAGSALSGLKQFSYSTPGTVDLVYNDPVGFIDFMSKNGHTVAGVIFEPVAANMGLILPENNFLKRMTMICRDSGAIVIADEVITGFRLDYKGARALYDFDSDITIFGKIVGGGLPLAVVGGSKDLMDLLMPEGNVFQAGTLSGNPIAVAAGMASLKMCAQDGFYEELQAKADFFLEPVEDFIIQNDLPVILTRRGSMFSFSFAKEKNVCFADSEIRRSDLFKKFFRKLYEEGIYLSPSVFETGFISSAHSYESLRYTSEMMIEVLTMLFPNL